MQVAPSPDDHVFDPTGDVQVGVGQVAEVAGVEPVVVEQRARRVSVVEIAGGRRGAAELDATLAAVAQLVAGGVDDADLVAGQGLAAGNETKYVLLTRRRRVGPPRTREHLAVDAVDERAPAQRRKGQPDRAFGQPVHRRDRVSPKPIGAEALGETFDGRGADRLGAVEGQPPAAQVESLQLGVGDLGQGELVGEVWACRDRGINEPGLWQGPLALVSVMPAAAW